MWSQLSSTLPPDWIISGGGGDDCIFDQKNLVYKYSTFCQDLNSESGTGKITLDSAFLPAPQVTTCNKIVASRQPSIFPRLHPPQVPDRPSPRPSGGGQWCREPNYTAGGGFFLAFFIVWERFYSPKPLFYKGFWKQNPKNFVAKWKKKRFFKV